MATGVDIVLIEDVDALVSERDRLIAERNDWRAKAESSARQVTMLKDQLAIIEAAQRRLWERIGNGFRDEARVFSESLRDDLERQLSAYKK